MNLKPTIIKFEDLILPKGIERKRSDYLLKKSAPPSPYSSGEFGLQNITPEKVATDTNSDLRWPTLPPRNLGIGVITYNRLPVLQRCISRILKFTLAPYHLMVADDGSSDGTSAWLTNANVPYVTGRNHGCAINKNRAIGYFLNYTDCDPIILIEEDSVPDRAGWELEWVKAAIMYGQVNFATSYQFDMHYVGGLGTVDNPYWCIMPSAQCTVTCRQELERVGYLDSRFRGYGHEHVEWTFRVFRDREYRLENDRQVFPTLDHGFELCSVQSYINRPDLLHNDKVIAAIMNTEVYRYPYREDGTGYMDGSTFQLEQRSSVNRNPQILDAPEVTPYRSDAFNAACARPLRGSHKNVVVTLATNNLRDTWLRSFLCSLKANGGEGFKTFVFYEDGVDQAAWKQLFDEYGVRGIPFRPIRVVANNLKNWSIKGLIYSVSQYIKAERYICMDCDTLVLDRLASVFDKMDLCCDESVYVASDGNGWGVDEELIRGATLSQCLKSLYKAHEKDVRRVAPYLPVHFEQTTLVCNSGVIAAPRAGMDLLYHRLKAMMPSGWSWLAEDPTVPREQCLFNIACAGGLGKELNGRYNWQLHNQGNGGVLVKDKRRVINQLGQRVAVLHFSGVSKEDKYPELLDAYRCGKPTTARTLRVQSVKPAASQTR